MDMHNTKQEQPALQREKKSLLSVKSNFLTCLPTFLRQLKLRGLSADQPGGQILLQIIRRVLHNSESTQNEHYLFNSVNDIATLLNAADAKDVQIIVKMLIETFSVEQLSPLINFVLLQEHMENPKDYARSRSAAGRFITELSEYYRTDYCNTVLLRTIKRLEYLIEAHSSSFTKYAYSFRDDPCKDLRSEAQDELTDLLNQMLSDIIAHKEKLPNVFRQVILQLYEINFVDIAFAVHFSDHAPVNIETIVADQSIKTNTYIIRDLGKSCNPEVYYWSTKKHLKVIPVRDYPSIVKAITEDDKFAVEQALIEVHNDLLKQQRITGLINTRFFGYIISQRAKALYRPEDKIGALMIHGMSKIISEALRQLANFNTDNKDPYLASFLNQYNIKRFHHFFRTTELPKAEHTANPIIMDPVFFEQEHDITYICYLEETFSRFQETVKSIQQWRQSIDTSQRLLPRFKKPNEQRVLAINMDTSLITISGARFCSLLNNISHYSHTNRALDKIQPLFQETLELALHYTLNRYILPFSDQLDKTNEPLKNHIIQMAQTDDYRLPMVTLLHLINSGDHPQLTALKKELKINFKGPNQASWSKFLEHTQTFAQHRTQPDVFDQQVQQLGSLLSIEFIVKKSFRLSKLLN